MSLLSIPKNTLIESDDQGYLLKRADSKELILRIPENRKAWFDLLRNSDLSLPQFLEEVMKIENRLPLQEALSFLQLLSQTGLLNGLISWQTQPAQQSESRFVSDLDVPSLVKELQTIDFFKDFGPQALQLIAERSMCHQVAPGSYVVHQGDEAKDFFVLLRGSVSVYVKNKSGVRNRVCVLREGTVFGEGSFEKNRVRGADVFAKDEIQILAISAELFEEVLRLHADQDLRARLKERVLVSQFLSTAALFKGLPQEALGLFVKQGSLIYTKKDQVLFEQGQIGNSFYLVIRGQVAVYRDQNPPVFLGQGDCFGEIALFRGIPRTATVKSFEESFLMSIPTEGFWQIILSNLGMALMLEEVAERRFRGEKLTLT